MYFDDVLGSHGTQAHPCLSSECWSDISSEPFSRNQGPMRIHSRVMLRQGLHTLNTRRPWACLRVGRGSGGTHLRCSGRGTAAADANRRRCMLRQRVKSLSWKNGYPLSEVSCGIGTERPKVQYSTTHTHPHTQTHTHVFTLPHSHSLTHTHAGDVLRVARAHERLAHSQTAAEGSSYTHTHTHTLTLPYRYTHSHTRARTHRCCPQSGAGASKATRR